MELKTQKSEVPSEVSMEGQIQHFLKNKDDHNFVWNRDFLWSAIQHLYTQRSMARKEIRALNVELAELRDLCLEVTLRDNKRDWGSILGTALLAGAVGLYLGIWLF